MSSLIAKYTVNIPSGSIHACTKYRPNLTSYDIHCVRVGTKAMLNDTPMLSDQKQRDIQGTTQLKDQLQFLCNTQLWGAHACENLRKKPTRGTCPEQVSYQKYIHEVPVKVLCARLAKSKVPVGLTHRRKEEGR